MSDSLTISLVPKKRTLTLLLAVFLTVLLALTFSIGVFFVPILPIKPAYGYTSYIFSDGLESGLFTGIWSGTTVGTSCTATVETTYPHTGVYDAKFHIAATYRQALVYKTFAGQSNVYCRFYFKVPTIVTSSQVELFEYIANGNSAIRVYLRNTAGTYEFGIRYLSGGSLSANIWSTQQEPTVGNYPCIEVYATTGTLTVVYKLYVNGNELTDISQSGKTQTDTITQINVGHCGDSGDTPDLYYDDVVVSTSYIGLETLYTQTFTGATTNTIVINQDPTVTTSYTNSIYTIPTTQTTTVTSTTISITQTITNTITSSTISTTQTITNTITATSTLSSTATTTNTATSTSSSIVTTTNTATSTSSSIVTSTNTATSTSSSIITSTLTSSTTSTVWATTLTSTSTSTSWPTTITTSYTTSWTTSTVPTTSTSTSWTTSTIQTTSTTTSIVSTSITNTQTSTIVSLITVTQTSTETDNTTNTVTNIITTITTTTQTQIITSLTSETELTTQSTTETAYITSVVTSTVGSETLTYTQTLYVLTSTLMSTTTQINSVLSIPNDMIFIVIIIALAVIFLVFSRRYQELDVVFDVLSFACWFISGGMIIAQPDSLVALALVPFAIGVLMLVLTAVDVFSQFQRDAGT